MKNSKRILSLVLALMMLVPMFVIGADAASTVEKIQEISSNFLGWEDTLTGPYASAGYYNLSKAEPLNGKAALRIHSDTGHLTNIKIVDPSKMQGVTKYSVSYKFKLESYGERTEKEDGTLGSWPNWIGIRVNSTQAQVDAGAQGDWLVYRNNADVEKRCFDASGADTSASKWGNRDATGGLNIKFTVDLTTGETKFYINGNEQTTMTSVSPNATNKATGIWLAVCGPQLSVVIDDLVVTNDATGTAIYSENFDFLATDSSVAPGTVLYEENFGSAVKQLNLANLGWTSLDGSYAKTALTATLSLSDSIVTGGAKSLKVFTTGGWSQIELLSKAQMAKHFTKGDTYVISMDIRLEKVHDWFVVSFGADNNPNTAHGQWVISRSSKNLYTQPYTNGSGGSTVSASHTFTWGNTNRWEIEVNTSTNKVSVYIDGVKKLDNATTTLSDIGCIFIGAYGDSTNGTTYYLDNITVTKGAYGSGNSPVYSENFESFSADSEAAPSANYMEQSAWHNTPAATNEIALLNGDTYLHLVGGTDSGKWHGYKLVPAKALKGVDRYTISYTMHIKQGGSGSWTQSAFMHFGSLADSSAGNWLQFGSGYDDANDATKGGDRFTFSQYDPSSKELAAYKGYDASYMKWINQDIKISVSVDNINKVANVYINGELAMANVAITHVENGDIYFGVRYHTDVYFDDIVVTAGTYADAAADFVGVQLGAIKDDKGAVRFAGVIGNNSPLDLETLYAVGFKITASYNGTTKTFTKPCGTVYDTLKGTKVANGVTIDETYTASEFGGKYIFATTIQNIPTSAGMVTFKVVPYFTLKDGSYAEGSSWTVTYNAATGTVGSLKLLSTMPMSIPTLSGATEVDVAGDTPMYYKSSTTLAVVQSYCKELEVAGFALYQSNQYDSAYYYIYVQGNATVTVSFANNVARVTVDRGGRAQNEADNAGWVATTTPTFTQLQLNNLVSGSNAGMGYVMRLSDGRFVVIDGGSADADDHIRLYNVMKDQCAAGKEPVIAAWFITHAHGDHFGNLYRFATKYQNKVVIEQVVQNLATSTILSMDASAAKTYDNIDHILSEIGAENVYARAGQSFYLADARIDMLFTADDVYTGSTLASGNGNNVCAVFKITIAGQSIMILGDTEELEANLITARYSATTLKSDMVQQAHHGYWAGSDTLYQRIAAKVVFWPCPTHLYYALASGGSNATTNKYNYQNATEIILAGNGTKTISLPHTPVASKPQNETYKNYANGNVAYSNNFESTSHVYQSGFWVIGQHVYQSAATETLGNPTDVYVATLAGDRGIVIDATKSGTQIGMIRPENFRGIGKYKIEMDLTILAKGEGVYYWLHDGEPGTSGNRLLPMISSYIGEGVTTKVVIEVTVNSSTSVTYVIKDGNGNVLKKSATSNTCSSESFFAIYMAKGSQAFIGSLQVTKVN